MEDRELIKEFQNGNEKAFDELVNKHTSWVKDFILRSIQHREDAEDISQDVFVKIYFGLPNFRFEAEFTTWAYRIIINQMNNYYRKQKLLSFFKFELREDIAGGYSEETEIPRQALPKLVEKLPRVQRNVMILRALQDMSFKQVANTLSITENSAKVSFFKAKNNLKKMVDHD